MLRRLREPASALTHLLGTLLSLAALVMLLWRGVTSGDNRVLLSFLVFGLSQIGLYAASTLYHGARLSPRTIDFLLRFDCAMVFVLIAGTYTPVCLLALQGGWRWGLLGAVWGLALAGIVAKLCWMTAPVWLSTGAYVLMGWVVIVALPTLAHIVPHAGMLWLFAGGIIYTLGAVIFALDRPALIPGIFDAHALWHLFVIGGSACCFWAIFQYVAPLASVVS